MKGFVGIVGAVRPVSVLLVALAPVLARGANEPLAPAERAFVIQGLSGYRSPRRGVACMFSIRFTGRVCQEFETRYLADNGGA